MAVWTGVRNMADFLLKRYDETWQGVARQGLARYGRVILFKAWLGVAGLGMARRGEVRLGMAGFILNEKRMLYWFNV